MTALTGLPESVRTRVVAQAADVLPDVPSLPAAVRRVASFAPVRRARLGESAIVAALADEELRERIGIQVAARAEPDPADDAAVAARAWLVRPEGWEALLADRVARVGVPTHEAESREIERLRGRLATAEQTVRELREAQRAQVEEHKAEHSSLRRKVGDARAAEREARAAAARAEDQLASARGDAEARVEALEKENRRLRAEVERHEAEQSQSRRAARSEREEATLRARLLLDTVIDAATGLRRELALPPATGAPADRVEAEVAAVGVRTPGSEALLEQLLAMPRSRLVVDGYNVTKRAWPSSSLEAQRNRLAGGLAALVARTGAETTVVFDAAETDHRPPVIAPRGVRVLYSPRGVIADDVVRDLVAVEPAGRVVVVVTADRAVADDVARDGARVVDPAALIALIGG